MCYSYPFMFLGTLVLIIPLNVQICVKSFVWFNLIHSIHFPQITGSPVSTPQEGRDAPVHPPPQYADLFSDQARAQAPLQQASKTDSSKPQVFKKGQKTDMSAWFNLFADLDPLANPDDIGREEGKEVEDRNC